LPKIDAIFVPLYPEGGLMKNRSSNLSVMIPFLFLAVNVREC